MGHVFLGLGLLTFFWILRGETIVIPKLVPFVGIATVLWGAIVLIKSFRIFSFEYLFFMNMQTGVPLLLVNMLTLLMSVVLGSWIATSVFGFRLAPVLATSALFSIVVGLALQETLGNLFSGIALQIDKPYTLGDWIEVQTGTQKLVGHVHEVTWRATILTSLTEEWITIP
jgi:small-conductance mechanosensitive channel